MTNTASIQDIYILSTHITHIMMHFYSFFIYTILHYNHILPINSVYCISKNKLAFNVNVISIDRSTSNYDFIKTIEFDGLNCIYYNYIISNNYKFLDLYKLKSDQIIKLIYFFKSSGFVKKIKYNAIQEHQTLYSIINISINPLIKKVIFFAYKDLQIPKYVLNNYCKCLIGLPENYKILNIVISKIYNWYRVRGFNHINIQLIKHHKSNTLFFKIHEGRIKCTILNRRSLFYINSPYIQFLETRIIKELFISPGYPVNIKLIEIGIKKLKDLQLISHCEYKIINFKDEQKVIVVYDIYKKQISYVKAQYINVYNKFKLKIQPLIIQQKIITIIEKLYNNFTKYFQGYDLQKNIKISNITSLLSIQSVYTKQLIKNLVFKYSNSDFNYQPCEHIISYSKMSKNHAKLNILIALPKIQIDYNMFAKFTLCFQQKTFYRNFVYPINRSYQQYNLNINNNRYNIKYYSQQACIKLQHHLLQYTQLNNNIHFIVQYINKNIADIQRKYFYCLSRQEANLNTYSIHTFKQFLQQVLLKFNIAIQYNNLDLKFYIQEGTSLILRLESHIYLSFKKLYIYNLAYLLKQYIYIQYYKILNLSQFILNKKTYKSILILSTKIYKPININNNLMVTLHDSIKLNNNIYQIINTSLYYQYVYSIEYHCFFPSYHSLYIFCSYANQCNYKSYDIIQDATYLRKYKDTIKYEIIIGSGIQFNIPISNIPPLRIEYCIGNKIDKRFQLSFYSQYK